MMSNEPDIPVTENIPIDPGGRDEDIGTIQELPVMLAVTEFIEYAILAKLAGAAGRSSSDQLSVEVKTMDSQIDADDSQPIWFQVKVKCLTNEQVKTDIFNFIRDSADSIRAVTKYSQKLEDKSHLYVETNQFGGGHLKLDTRGEFHITEHTEPEEESKPKLLMRFRVFQSRSHMLRECQLILQYMRKLRLLNPDIILGFHVDIFGTVSSSDIGPVTPCVRTAQRRVLASSKHFIKESGVQHKLQIKSSGCFTISMLKKDNYVIPDIKLYVLSTLIPSPSTLPIKCDKCQKIQVVFLGPGGIPLIVPHVSFGDADVTSLLSLPDFGANVSCPVKTDPSSSPDVIWPDYQYQISPDGTSESAAGSSTSSRPSNPSKKHVIQLIIILDKAKDNFSTENYLEFLDSIRQNLQHLITLRKQKIRRPISVSLEKVLIKKKTIDEKIHREKVLKRAIPTISNAICTVLMQSVNKTFRTECFDMMKVTNTRAMKRVLHKNLWSIGSQVYGVMPSEETSLPFEERMSQPPTQAEPDASHPSPVPQKRRKLQKDDKQGDIPTPNISNVFKSQSVDSVKTQPPAKCATIPNATTQFPPYLPSTTTSSQETLSTLAPTLPLEAGELNFDALGTAFIRDETMYQDDICMGEIADIEMAERILLEEVRQITGAPLAEKLEASIDDSWFNDLIDDPEFLV